MVSSNNHAETASADEDLHQLEVTKWRTLSSVFQENVESLLRAPALSDHFSKEYVQNVANRHRELQRTDYRLSVVLFLLIIFSGAVESGAVRDIAVFGVQLSAETSALAVLVLVSSLLMFLTSAVSLMADNYSAVIRSLTPPELTDDAGKYYRLQYLWDTGTIFDGFMSRDDDLLTTRIVFSLMLLFFSVLVVAAVILVTLEFYILARAIVSIYERPTLPPILNVPIVVFAACAALFGVGAHLMRLPLPYTDISNLRKLHDLQTSDPARADRIWRQIATHNLRKERRNTTLLQLVVMLVTMISLYLLTGRDFLSDYSRLVPVVATTVCFVYFVSPLLDKYEGSVILAEAAIDDKKARVEQYVEDKKKILRRRLLVSVLFGGLAYFYFELDDLYPMLTTWIGEHPKR